MRVLRGDGLIVHRLVVAVIIVACLLIIATSAEEQIHARELNLEHGRLLGRES